MNRRGFLQGMIAAGTGAAIIPIDRLMRPRVVLPCDEDWPSGFGLAQMPMTNKQVFER